MPKEKEKFDKHKYNDKYSNEHYTMVRLRFSKEKDVDVMGYLKSLPSMTDYVRQCVRRDIEKSKE